ncbi:nucleotide-binding universal stress UspA family protein [Actinoplanes tereljensis]|uniref:Universal stress protein n=1 Tax=Paractinoplanes tereljensis TaxID=571912 RepID=A0A919NLT3_9ACTN|nr:universal stress protein [Actinoplanes tereljensis]GIF20858.1 universal stress protein [Actinoplanes tereljensis]
MSVIAATDGTESANVAVAWAAQEARRRRASLRIVYAYDSDWLESRFDIGAEYLDVAESLAKAVVADARDRAMAAVPGLHIETDILPGHAIPRLLEVAEGADLLVLGSRGRGGFSGLVLGSVSQRLATHAPCPVAVVRDEASGDGPVVAGVDDTPSAEFVLPTAFAAAAERDTTLIVIRSYLPAIPRWLATVPMPADLSNPADDPGERERLEEQLAPWRDRYPQVRVETVLTHDGAAAALVGATKRAALTVVGSHGHGTLAAALLGSTVLQLLHHADCPVMVVR